MPDKIPSLRVVIPVYNEEAVLSKTAPLFPEQLNLMKKKQQISDESRIVFVDDGSTDNTWDIIEKLHSEGSAFEGLSLSRNKGHQNALLAGLMDSINKCDITISIDCDGQDDISVMSQMVEEYLTGSEVVYGVRKNRDTDTIFKRESALVFYRLMRRLGAEVVFNHADYRLVSTKVLRELSDFTEVNIFLRGLFPLVGFKSTCVYYERKERVAGKSHYPLRKMISLAIDGITSLSIKPIRIITLLGFSISFFAFLLIVYVLVSWAKGDVVPGWSSSLISSSLLGGIQLVAIGVIGEYIGKIYLETKRRPRYIIDKRTEENT